LKINSQQRNNYTVNHIALEGRYMQHVSGGVDVVVIGFKGTDGTD